MADYWDNRTAAEIDRVTRKNQKQIEEEIKKYYKRSMEKTLDDFEKTYEKILHTVNDLGREATPADLYKLDQYWQMQGQLKRELQKLGDKEASVLSEAFERTWKEVYKAISLPSGAAYSTLPSESTIKALLQSVWAPDGKQWSARIWGNTSKLAETLNEELINCVIGGRQTRELKQRLIERFNVSYNQAKRLVNTELAHIQTQAAQERYKSYGLQEVQFWADPDERTCYICGEMHKKKFPVDTKGLVPQHCNCRCCVVPVIPGID